MTVTDTSLEAIMSRRVTLCYNTVTVVVVVVVVAVVVVGAAATAAAAAAAAVTVCYSCVASRQIYF